MDNINPLFIIQPVTVILISSLLMVYFYRKYHFQKKVFLYSLVAYAGAIIIKYVIQIFTYTPALNLFGEQSIGLGFYFGIQTVVLEVGLAYFVALYATKRSALASKDSQAYGSGLAFWENAVYLGIFPFINLVTYFSVLSTNSALAQTLYNQLIVAAPSLFAGNSQALALVALGTIERVSSILLHFAWGFLCFMAALRGKKILFLIALPMGFVDFLVPFASLNTVMFEAAFFAIAVVCVLVAYFSTKGLLKNNTGAVSDQKLTRTLQPYTQKS